MAKRQTDAVVETILLRIEDGTLMPGDAIEEKDLIEACGVSRTPVREALIQLEADGLVVRHARKGVSLFRPNTDEFLSILEVHATLEAQAAELAAERLSLAAEATIEACTKACERFAKDADPANHNEYYNLNRLYHAAIADASCNIYLVDLIKLNARKLMAHYRLRYRTPGAIEQSAQEHRVISDRIFARDSSGARAAMFAHFNYERETVMHMIASLS